MGYLAEFEITCDALPFVEVAAAVPDATLELEFQPSEDWYTAFIVQVVEGNRKAVEQAFDESPFVDEYIPMQQSDERPWYRVEPAVGMDARLGAHVDEVSTLKALAAADAEITYMRVTATGWIQRGWFASRATLERFQSFWQRNGEFTLRRLVPDGEADDAGTGLTDRQRDAILTAHEMGYFDIPRRASLDDVAAELDIAASSLSERLRRAQSHLIKTSVPHTIDTSER
ncbi:helix-turn-helix domain-containing protein [Halovenus marina]|uniref:helix-turn-helix domain-containing protein n=1 Tax=Halovenus marina TaxID=3396621 RepID=UPI003F564E3F